MDEQQVRRRTVPHLGPALPGLLELSSERENGHLWVVKETWEARNEGPHPHSTASSNLPLLAQYDTWELLGLCR